MTAPLDDMVALGPVFANIQVVYLGESTHDDGGVTTARLRFVRYLYEVHGFDTLMYEAPRIPCAQANLDLLAGQPGNKVLPAAVKAIVTLNASVGAGYNDGYADNLSLIITQSP
jgi:erythromycin esterase-like protein